MKNQRRRGSVRDATRIDGQCWDNTASATAQANNDANTKGQDQKEETAPFEELARKRIPNDEEVALEQTMAHG